jgi:hypothetical protein
MPIFVGPAGHRVRNRTENPGGCRHKRHCAKQAEQERAETRLGETELSIIADMVSTSVTGRSLSTLRTSCRIATVMPAGLRPLHTTIAPPQTGACAKGTYMMALHARATCSRMRSGEPSPRHLTARKAQSSHCRRRPPAGGSTLWTLHSLWETSSPAGR